MSDATNLVATYDRIFAPDTVVSVHVPREHWLKISALCRTLSLAEEGLANYEEENERLRRERESLRKSAQTIPQEWIDDNTRLREAIETHRQAIGNGANMVEADEELWAILQPEPQPDKQA